MRTLLVSCVLVLGACASQQAAQPAAPAPASPAPPAELASTLPDWNQKINDAAGAAARLAVAEDFQAHPLPPQMAQAPSEKSFSNVLVLHHMTTQRFVGAMHGMSKGIGSRCSECHVEGNFASDEKKEKRVARKMLLLSQRLNQEIFHGHVELSCYSCHHGEEHPEAQPSDVTAKRAALALPPSLPAVTAGAKRADEVYKNLQLLGGLPPAQLVPAMQDMSIALGVGCDRCHVPGDWASDDKHDKQIARQMILLAQSANAELFGTAQDDDAVTCWTCHRGEKHPKRLIAKKRPTPAAH